MMAYCASRTPFFIPDSLPEKSGHIITAMNRKASEQIKALELVLLHAKAQLRPNETRIGDLESQLAKLKREV
jgi:uncharacterized protein YcaQ